MIVRNGTTAIFEWVVTEDERSREAGLVGACRIGEHHGVDCSVRAALQVAAGLPCTFSVFSTDNEVILRGKCSDIRKLGLSATDFAASGPIKLAATFHIDAHRVQYKIGDALMGIYY